MRIIGGTYRGKKIEWIDKNFTRPTRDSVREAIFNIYCNGYGYQLSGKKVLDLFAGTGSLGLEAFSRGAQEITFVENNNYALNFLNRNRQSLNALEHTKVIKTRVEDLLAETPASEAYDLIFIDPPYKIPFWKTILKRLHKNNWVHAETVIILETPAEIKLETPLFDVIEDRVYRKTRVMFLKSSNSEK